MVWSQTYQPVGPWLSLLLAAEGSAEQTSRLSSLSPGATHSRDRIWWKLGTRWGPNSGHDDALAASWNRSLVHISIIDVHWPLVALEPRSYADERTAGSADLAAERGRWPTASAPMLPRAEY